MNSFLRRIAQTFYREYGNDMSKFCFVFPNRRAGLFFQRYLAEIIERPMFSPEIITINECFFSAVNGQEVDHLGALFRLYDIYRQTSGSNESFDNFVYWGEMLLTDFDDIDKYLADPKQVFTNITELKEIDLLFNSFTENQLKAIREFWKNFDPLPDSQTSLNFIATWKILLPLYERFRQSLREEGLFTEGMVCRHVAECLGSGQTIEAFAGKQFVFVGFNALTLAEKTLFKELKKSNQADFYWDYEATELRDPDNPASRFYAENITAFPSKLTVEPVVEDLRSKHFELWAVPSQAGQAKHVHTLLNGIFPEGQATDGINTAVVLPDESMLIPLLHSLPVQVEKVNVTMGFPLKATPATGLVELIFELQRRKKTTPQGTSFYFQTVLNILNHQYIHLACGDLVQTFTNDITANNRIYVDEGAFAGHALLSTLFTPQTSTDKFLPYLMSVLRQLQENWRNATEQTESFQLELDFLYQYYIVLNRMQDIMQSRPAGLEMSTDTLMRLIRELTAGISIPFVGEPLAGLQIMGALETRGLDFENIIITSFNEGVFPRRSPQNSFIPYNLRKGFELPTAEHQDALAAYNFYRLIHHARNIYLLYDSRTEGLQTGEVSRFAHQLHYHYGVPIQHRALTFDVSFTTPSPLQINKTDHIMHKLSAFLHPGQGCRALSASSINCYIDCPMKFYLTHIEDMRQADEVAETIEDNMFGTLFHAVMEYIYTPYKGQLMQAADFDRIIDDKAGIDRHIAKAFAINYFKRKNDTLVPLEGNNLLVAHVLRKYVIQTLLIDKKNAPFIHITSEESCHVRFPLSDGTRQVNLKGYIDRVDEKDRKIRILDYKTGRGTLDFKNFEEAFQPDRDPKKASKYLLQTFLYGILYKEKAAGKAIMPCIYYMRDTFKDNFEDRLHYKNKDIDEYINDFSPYESEFREHLTTCLDEIFDPQVPFRQNISDKPCQYCDYKIICNR